MHHKRGNIESEQNAIGFDQTASELQDVTAYTLRDTFEGVTNKIFIYALIDPRNLEVRYIGKTNNPKERMRAHISPHIYMRHNNKKCIWIEELKAMNLKPVMSVLTTCQVNESELYEYRYYKLFKDACDLLNAATISKETMQYNLTF